MRRKVKITVIKKEFYPEIADKYLMEGRAVGACPELEVGNTFIYEGGAVMPEGFCPWAWVEICSKANALAANAENNWYRPNVSVACCTDGVRPVVFLLEGMDQVSLEEE